MLGKLALLLVFVAAPTPARAGDNVPGDPLFAKLTPALRMRLASKTAAPMRAVAQLRRPLPPEVAAQLAQTGLTLLSANPDALFVSGDAESILRLAARDEVARIALSAPLKPSVRTP